MANLRQIERRLRKLKLHYKIVDFGSEIYTVGGVIETGVNADSIVKTLIICTNEGFVALAIEGNDRLDFKKVRKLFGSKSELAKPADVLTICGVPIGAVCPILLNIPVYFDEKVMNLNYVNIGSGDLTKSLEMDLVSLIKAVGRYEIMNLTST